MAAATANRDLTTRAFVLAFLAGIGAALQASFNGALAVPLKSPYTATCTSFCTGVLFLTFFAPIDVRGVFDTGPLPPSSDKLSQSEIEMTSTGPKDDQRMKAPDSQPPSSNVVVEPWMWLFPGAVGSFYVSLGPLLGPRLGFSLYFLCIIAGQLAASLLIDHIGFMGLPKERASLPRVAAIGLVLVGASVAAIERLEQSDTAIELTIAYALCACLSGGLLTFQGPVNKRITQRLKTYPNRTALLTFVEGWCFVVAVLGVVWFSNPDIRSPNWGKTDWWMFFGGPLGANFVLMNIVLPPIIGSSLYFMIFVAGEVIMSMAVDSLGLFNSQQIALTPMRICGVLVVILGAILFRFQSKTAKLKTNTPPCNLPPASDVYLNSQMDHTHDSDRATFHV